MANALSAAAAQAAGLREMFGSMSKSLHAGKAAANGLLSALLAQEGWVSAAAGLEGVRGYWAVLAVGADPSLATANLGQTWELHRNGFKPYACGVVTHPTIDCASELARISRLRATDVEEIRCRVNPYVLELTGKLEPSTGLEGKFSIYHCAAVGYLDGTARLSQFSDAAVHRPEVVALRQRVHAEVDKDLPTNAAAVTLKARDGRTWSVETTAATGTPDNPMSDEALSEKFMALVDPHLGTDSADKVCQLALGASRIGRLSDLTDPIAERP
jgi:2-methylcitrate dehydratase PrpD